MLIPTIITILVFIIALWYINTNSNKECCDDEEKENKLCHSKRKDFYRKTRHVIKTCSERLLYKASSKVFINNIAIRSNVDTEITVRIDYNDGTTYYLYNGEISRTSVVVINENITKKYKGANIYIYSNHDMHATLYLRGYMY